MMRTLATKQFTERNSTSPTAVRTTSKPNGRSLFPGSTMLQRKPGCACGGGCPRCQEKALLQTKLKISEPGDRYEQEADRIADEIMRMPEPSRQIEPEMVQRKTIGDRITPLAYQPVLDEKEENIKRKLGNTSSVTPSAANISTLQDGGQPLPKVTRQFFESRFGRDLSRVRIHTNFSASESARALQAHAYTLGHHIIFASEQYAPQKAVGQRLLAHELVHVIQQSHASKHKTIQRDSAGSRVHASPGLKGGKASDLAGIPSEKWSEIIEQQYRARGDVVRANAVRACRLQGRAACARILTIAEVTALHALSKNSGGDREKITTGLAGAAPLLAPQTNPVSPSPVSRPPLQLVPPSVSPSPVATPAAGAEVGAGISTTSIAVAGVAAIAVILVIAGTQLWESGRFQEALRAEGFIILEDPLGLCIGGCHLPSRPVSPKFPDFELKPSKPPLLPETPFPLSPPEEMVYWWQNQPQPESRPRSIPYAPSDIDFDDDETDRRGCRIQSIPMQFGRVPCHADFAKKFSGVRREFRVTTPTGLSEDFDARDPIGTLYEVKTGYGWILNEDLTPFWRERKAKVIERFQKQASVQLGVAESCVRPLIWYFNNQSVAEYFNSRVEPPVQYLSYNCQTDSDHLW